MNITKNTETRVNLLVAKHNQLIFKLFYDNALSYEERGEIMDEIEARRTELTAIANECICGELSQVAGG